MRLEIRAEEVERREDLGCAAVIGQPEKRVVAGTNENVGIGPAIQEIDGSGRDLRWLCGGSGIRRKGPDMPDGRVGLDKSDARVVRRPERLFEEPTDQFGSFARRGI